MSSSAQALIAQYAEQYGVPLAIATGVAMRESGMNQNVPNGAAGEIGMYQLMPATAAQLGVNPSVEQENIQGGIAYLAQMYAEFDDWAAAVAAYNDGPGNIANDIAAYGPNWLAMVPESTQAYVSDVVGVSAATYGTVPSTGLTPLTDDSDAADDDSAPGNDELVPAGFLETDGMWLAGLLVAGVAAIAIARQL